MSEITLPYVWVADEAPPNPPYVEVEIDSPGGRFLYTCLLDSGANFSAFPADSLDEFRIDEADLIDTSVRTAANRRPARHLRNPGILTVTAEGKRLTGIAPYFLLDRDEAGVEIEYQEPVLGRDFFLGFEEVAFRQTHHEVVLRGSGAVAD